MSTEAQAIVIEGLKRALIEATCGLYRVYTSVDREKGYEERFAKGIEKQMTDYDRMVALVGKKV